MRAFIPALLLGSLVFVAILYISAFQPHLLTDAGQRLGFVPAPEEASQAEAARRERERRRMIDALLIAPANKEDLKQGRPFWGAAPHMLAMAMGREPDGTVARMRQGVLYEWQNYFFSDRRGLMTFEFQGNKLTCLHYLREARSLCAPGGASLYGDAFPYAENLSLSTAAN